MLTVVPNNLNDAMLQQHGSLREYDPTFQHVTLLSDSIFFPKSAIRIGQLLKCIGRTYRPYSWEVQQIESLMYVNGQKIAVNVDSAQRMTDRVKLVCLVTGQVKILPFSYLSYSAIWQLSR